MTRRGSVTAREPNHLDRALARHGTTISLTITAVALVIAWRLRFVQDDAFISFQYARSLVEGHGLTWFGDRVEGYTNFLWVLWIALGMKLGIDPVLWSWVGGMIAFAIALQGLWQLAVATMGPSIGAVLALILFASNYTVLAYATGGLETMLQTALLTWALVATLHVWAAENMVPWAARLSAILALALLTRLDSGLHAAILIGVTLVVAGRHGRSSRTWMALLLPVTIVLGAWFAWKLAFYGQLLPQTYAAKVNPTPELIGNGALYVWRFFQGYWLWPLFAIGLVAMVWRRKALDRRLALVMTVTVVWLGYVVWVGGDFMEFRMFVPIAPGVFLLLAWCVAGVIGQGRPRWAGLAGLAAACTLVSASILHARSFRDVTPDRTLDSIPALSTFYGLYPDHDFGRIGRLLRARLGGANPILALHAVGAVPFYSGFRTVDMLGLNDRYVSEHGQPSPRGYRRPGHVRRAPLEYLRRRGVNFILGHPGNQSGRAVVRCEVV